MANVEYSRTGFGTSFRPFSLRNYAVKLNSGDYLRSSSGKIRTWTERKNAEQAAAKAEPLKTEFTPAACDAISVESVTVDTEARDAGIAAYFARQAR